MPHRLTHTQQVSLLLAWLIALAALFGTLFASEYLNMPVCHSCWYQRICLYPLALILGVACFREDTDIIPNIIALPLISAAFALYQYLEQMIPGFGPIDLCGAGPSCSNIHIQWLGFITFPLLSFLASLAIFILLLLARKKDTSLFLRM